MYNFGSTDPFLSQYFYGPIVKPHQAWWGCKVRKQPQTGPHRPNLTFDSFCKGLYKRCEKSIDYTDWSFAYVSISQCWPTIKINSCWTFWQWI